MRPDLVVAVVGRLRRHADQRRDSDQPARDTIDAETPVGDVADALGVGSVAMRCYRQRLAIATAANARVSGKSTGTQWFAGCRRRAKVIRLGSIRVQYNRDLMTERIDFPEFSFELNPQHL